LVDFLEMYSADGFKFLSVDELQALVFRLDLAETVEAAG